MLQEVSTLEDLLNDELVDQLDELVRPAGYTCLFSMGCSRLSNIPVLMLTFAPFVSSHPIATLLNQSDKRLSVTLGQPLKTPNRVNPVLSQLYPTHSMLGDCPLRDLWKLLDKTFARMYRPTILKAEAAWTYLDSFSEKGRVECVSALKKLFVKDADPFDVHGVPVDTLLDSTWRHDLLNSVN
jgi:hypothetical protein